ncbi:MAG: tetratricopeptide repeat protein [Anaerolineae bacterium]
MHRCLRIVYGSLILALLALAGCGGEVETPTPPDLESLKAQIEAGEYQAAVQVLEEIVANNEENAEAYFLLGLSYFNLNQYQKARDAFNRALELDPQRAAAIHHNLGALAYQMGDIETAETEFKAALEIEPDDPDTHYQLGATYLIKALPAEQQTPDPERLAQARAEFEQALELAPGKAEALVGLGNSYLLENRLEEAIETLAKAVEASPEMPEALFALGRAYALNGQSEEAREVLERFLDTNPPEVWAQQAQQLLNQLGD